MASREEIVARLYRADCAYGGEDGGGVGKLFGQFQRAPGKAEGLRRAGGLGVEDCDGFGNGLLHFDVAVAHGGIQGACIACQSRIILLAAAESTSLYLLALHDRLVYPRLTSER